MSTTDAAHDTVAASERSEADDCGTPLGEPSQRDTRCRPPSAVASAAVVALRKSIHGTESTEERGETRWDPGEGEGTAAETYEDRKAIGAVARCEAAAGSQEIQTCRQTLEAQVQTLLDENAQLQLRLDRRTAQVTLIQRVYAEQIATLLDQQKVLQDASQKASEDLEEVATMLVAARAAERAALQQVIELEVALEEVETRAAAAAEEITRHENRKAVDADPYTPTALLMALPSPQSALCEERLPPHRTTSFTVSKASFPTHDSAFVSCRDASQEPESTHRSTSLVASALVLPHPEAHHGPFSNRDSSSWPASPQSISRPPLTYSPPLSLPRSQYLAPSSLAIAAVPHVQKHVDHPPVDPNVLSPYTLSHVTFEGVSEDGRDADDEEEEKSEGHASSSRASVSIVSAVGAAMQAEPETRFMQMPDTAKGGLATMGNAASAASAPNVFSCNPFFSSNAPSRNTEAASRVGKTARSSSPPPSTRRLEGSILPSWISSIASFLFSRPATVRYPPSCSPKRSPQRSRDTERRTLPSSRHVPEAPDERALLRFECTLLKLEQQAQDDHHEAEKREWERRISRVATERRSIDEVEARVRQVAAASKKLAGLVQEMHRLWCHSLALEAATDGGESDNERESDEGSRNALYAPWTAPAGTLGNTDMRRHHSHAQWQHRGGGGAASPLYRAASFPPTCVSADCTTSRRSSSNGTEGRDMSSGGKRATSV